MNKNAFLKQAYLQGLEKAANEAYAEGFKKEAIWGALSKALPWIGRLGKGAIKAAPSATGAASTATKAPGLLGHAKSLFGFGGKGTLGSGLSAPLRPFLGREGAHQALGFGTLGGTIGALGAEEGDRLKAFGKGFGLGTIGGAGWHVGQKGSQALMKGIARTGGKNVGSVRKALRRVTAKPAAGKQDLQGLSKIYSSGKGPLETAKYLGARGAYGVGGLGAGILASGAAESKAEKYIPSLRSTAPHTIRQLIKPPFAAAQAVSRGRLGLTPGEYR